MSVCMQSVGERPAISEREPHSSSEKDSKARTHRLSPRQEKSTAGEPPRPSHATRESEACVSSILQCCLSVCCERRCCARHTVHGQSSPTACVWSDKLIAQPACYWVTESHQVAPPAQTPTVSKPYQREKKTNKPCMTNVRELSFLYAWQTTHSAGHSLFKVVPRPVCACAR